MILQSSHAWCGYGFRARYSDLEEHDVNTTTDWCYELVRSELFSPLLNCAVLI